jgi:hypothetical protein
VIDGKTKVEKVMQELGKYDYDVGKVTTDTPVEFRQSHTLESGAVYEG